MDISSWLTDTITVETQGGTTPQGDPIWGAQAPIAARVQGGRDRKSQEIDHTDHFYTQTQMFVNQRFWLPGANTADASLCRQAKAVKHVQSRSDDVTIWNVLF